MESELQPREVGVTDASPNVLDQDRLYLLREKLKLEQNLLMGIAGGFGAAVVGAILWAIITVASGYQIGYMAVGVGFIVGYSVRYLGKGIAPSSVYPVQPWRCSDVCSETSLPLSA